MTRALAVAVLLSAGAARADDNGLMMELNVLGANSFGNVLTVLPAGAGGTATTVLSPSAAFGFAFGSNAILLNVGLLGFGPGTNISFSVNPLFRHYMEAPHHGAVSPFFEGGLSFGFLSPASGPSNYIIGILGGLGAEWVFVEHLGLIVDALLEYGHAHFGYGGFGGEVNIDVIGVAGNVGVTVHW